MTNEENVMLVRLLKEKSDELMDKSKKADANEKEELFQLSCECANIANKVFHLEIKQEKL